MLSTSTLAVLALQLGSALAAPTAQSGYDPCDPNQESSTVDYVNNPGSKVFAGAPFTGGVLCSGDGTCVSSIQENYAVSYTITVGTSFELDISEIVSAGVEVSVSVTTETSIGEGGQDTCPQGAWTCALAITPYFADVTGTATPNDSCSGAGDPENYEVAIPEIDGSNNAIIKVGTCACPDMVGWADPGAPPTCPGPCA